MPLTPSFGDRLAGPIVQLYTDAEHAVLQWIAVSLTQDSGVGTGWLQRTLLRLPRFRRGVGQIVVNLDRAARARVDTALSAAWRDGATAARADIPDANVHHDERAIRDLVDRVLAALAISHHQIPVTAETIYRRVVDEAVRHPSATTEPARRTLMQRALDRFARRGFTGFVDGRSRQYDLVSYAEMTVRTAISYAEVEAYTQQLAADGHDLIIVSDVVGSCPLCSPYEGQLLSISGATVGAIARDDSSGRSVTVTVMSSLADARANGFLHRGCRHTLGLWTPDDPAPPAAVRLSDQAREARRHRRALEHRLRARQRVQHVAQSPEAARTAANAVASARADLRSV